MHKTNCMQSIEQISKWEVFSSICPIEILVSYARNILTASSIRLDNSLDFKQRQDFVLYSSDQFCHSCMRGQTFILSGRGRSVT